MNTIPPIRHFNVRAELGQAVVLDPGLSAIVEQIGYPDHRRSPADFSTLARIINAQQLSYHAAEAIWTRLMHKCQDEMTPVRFIDLSWEALRECGLSRTKIQYIQELAGMIQCRAFKLESLVDLPDDQLINSITRVKGVGVWSAEIYAMNALGRPDIFPARDLALQAAVKHYAGMGHRPDESEMRAFSNRWEPHRSSVALLLWKLYRSLRT